jgi:hypothetical protein
MEIPAIDLVELTHITGFIAFDRKYVFLNEISLSSTSGSIAHWPAKLEKMCWLHRAILAPTAKERSPPEFRRFWLTKPSSPRAPLGRWA